MVVQVKSDILTIDGNSLKFVQKFILALKKQIDLDPSYQKVVALPWFSFAFFLVGGEETKD